MSDTILTCDRCQSPITGDAHWAIDQVLCSGCASVASAAQRIRLANLLQWLEMQTPQAILKQCRSYWTVQFARLIEKQESEKKERRKAQIAAIRAHAKKINSSN